ncbi:2-hydroxyacid dehydrogenase [Candidatus Sumerlaeota bacterium]|nr:2-hydroxyacid dehydrogenase [Candidatus Sumerlaeota bacterium]
MKALLMAEFDDEYYRKLCELMEVVRIGWGKNKALATKDEIKKEIKDTDILIVEGERIDRDIIDSASRLKLICVARGTPVNLDLSAIKERGIPIVYTPGRNTRAVAEFTVGLMLALARHIAFANHLIREKYWLADSHIIHDEVNYKIDWTFNPEAKYNAYGEFKGVQLEGKVCGVIGLGRIGREVARLVNCFGMQTLGYDPYIDKENAGRWVSRICSIQELLKESDFITIHCSVTPETTHLINEQALRLMKPGAFLINTSRGAIIDEQALYRALKERWIAGAALDVLQQEPPPSSLPILSLDNVIITPHIAGATYEIMPIQSEMILAEIKRFLSGEELKYQYKI